jgi:hypothetical protein
LYQLQLSWLRSREALLAALACVAHPLLREPRRARQRCVRTLAAALPVLLCRCANCDDDSTSDKSEQRSAQSALNKQ